MDPNRLLIWIVCLSSGLNFVQAAMWTGLRSATALIPGFILLTTVIASVVRPELGGWIGGVLWAGLLLLPSLAFRQISRLISEGHYGLAHGLAQGVSILYWLYGLADLPRLLRALVDARQGDLNRAHQALDHQLGQRTSTLVVPLVLELFRVTARWEECLSWIQGTSLQRQLERDPGVSLAYLRALGETGKLRDLVWGYRQVASGLEEGSGVVSLPLAQLMVLAFCGEVEGVIRLFTGPLSDLPPPIQRFWLGTAEQAAGNQIGSVQEWQVLSQEQSLATAVQRRLTQPLADPRRALGPEDWQQVDRISDSLSTHPQTASVKATEIPYATYGLIGLNLGVFGLELALGGSTNPETLYFLGGLDPVQVWAGQWWRTLTSTMLHYGWLHLVMNMLGLLVLGPVVERSIGILRFLGLYWGAGVGSMAVITVLSATGLSTTDFVVGASGSIMGLVGGSAVIFWRIWQRQRSPQALRQLRMIWLIIVLQLIFDLTTPRISVVGHSSGLILGFLIAGIWVLTDRDLCTHDIQ